MAQEDRLPGTGLKTERTSEHSLLTRLGKRVQRPGAVELTDSDTCGRDANSGKGTS